MDPTSGVGISMLSGGTKKVFPFGLFIIILGDGKGGTRVKLE